MVYRPNFEIPVSTRVDKETKQKLDTIAFANGQKPAELLRKIIEDFLQAKSLPMLPVDQTKRG